MSTIEQPNYLNKSVRIFRFYTIASLILILLVMLLSSLRQNYLILISAITLLPVLIPLILAPMGLYYKPKKSQGKNVQCSLWDICSFVR